MSLSKAAGSHKMLQVEDAKCHQTLNCDACLLDEKYIPAVSLCNVCTEKLCDLCADSHRKRRATKSHKLDDIRQIVVNENYCDICKNAKQVQIASSYCDYCEEQLCQACSDKHKMRKATKSHELTEINARKSREVWESDMISMQKCEKCYNQKGFFIAAFFCKMCELHLCNSCSSQHLIQTVTERHKLISLEEQSRGNGSYGNEKQNRNATAPGIPIAEHISTSEIKISWKGPEKKQGAISHYDIRFRETGAPKWRVFSTNTSNELVTVTDLKCDTVYQFKVRAVYGDTEGIDSLVSDEIRTKVSLAREVKMFAIKLDSKRPEAGQPCIYKIQIEENPNCRNSRARTRKCVFGDSANERPLKTIMVLGATGSGKTTLIDGMINYIFDVSWEDDFRFSIIDLMDVEKKKNADQTQSQTEWITCYTVNWKYGSRIPYNLNIIDTPGFGDTRGIERDHRIVEQVRELFTLNGKQGISVIDGVCFVTQAPLGRLTVTQKYIIDSMLSIFGRDIIGNIFALITFADGKTPPVLKALQSAEVPIRKSFKFNNSALFEPNKDIGGCSFSSMFWKMGTESFKMFFDHLNKVEPRSLQLTSEVLKERQHLETLVQGLRPQIDEGLAKIETLQQENKTLERHKYDIEHNRNFKYEVEETHQQKVDLNPGIHVTNCLTCNRTCHDDCAYADDADKIKCSSMTNGYCRICPKHCIWNVHKNNPYKFEFFTVKVSRTYEELKLRYESAKTGALKQGGVVAKIMEELKAVQTHVYGMVERMRISINRLSEIALKPNPLSSVDYIDLLIESEKQEKKPGYINRINELKTYRKNAEVVQNSSSLNYKPF